MAKGGGQVAAAGFSSVPLLMGGQCFQGSQGSQGSQECEAGRRAEQYGWAEGKCCALGLPTRKQGGEPQVRISPVIPARLSLEGLQKKSRMEEATRSSCLAHHNSWMSSPCQWWRLT